MSDIVYEILNNLEWSGQVVIKHSHELNAWHSGNSIIVTDRLIQKAHKNELAFILAHEVAHSTTKDELTADIIAVKLTMDAGYDPLAGAEFLRRTDYMGRWSRTHPPIACRISAIKAMVAYNDTFGNK